MRHSYAHQMKDLGVKQEDLAVAMGHGDTSMLDAIYAKATSPRELAKRFADAIQVQRAAHLTVIPGGKTDDKARSA